MSAHLNRWTAAAMLFVTCCLTFAAGSAEEKKAPPDPIQKAVEVYRADQRLQSFRAKGTFEVFEQGKGETNLRQTAKANVSLVFDKPKYYVRLDFEQRRLVDLVIPLHRAIVAFDGKAFLVSCFSPAYRPLECEGSIYMHLSELREYFPWDATKIATSVFNVEPLINDPKGNEKLKETADLHRYKFGVINSNKSYVTCDISPTQGFRMTDLSVFNIGNPLPVQHWSGKWKQQRGIWFVEEYAEEMDFRTTGWIRTRNVLKLTEVEFNPKIPSRLFTEHALELKEGARIVDRRHDTPREKRIREYKLPRESSRRRSPITHRA